MRTRDLILCTILIAVGVWITLLWQHAPGPVFSFDLYSYYLPNVLYTLQRLGNGGSGLLWNPYQNCGQPSFGISSTGTLYPPNLAYLVLPPSTALLVVMAINFIVAGLGMYALLRELGSGRTGALCGALAFELGTATVDLSSWGPQMSGPYVYIGWAMLFCERILRAPSLGNAIGLAASLALPLLPGFPQCVVFTYQLIALRALFEFATRWRARPWSRFATLALGLALPPLLIALQLVPGLEMASQSVRGKALSFDEIRGHGFLDLQGIQRAMSLRNDLFNPALPIPALVATASWLRSTTRRHAVFYALAGVLFLLLAMGPATPLFDLYLQMPLGRLFREFARFVWMTSFCLAVLAGLGVDAILWSSRQTSGWRRWRPAGLTAAGLVGLYFLYPNRLLRAEWILSGLVISGAAVASFGDAARRVAAVLIVAAVALNLFGYRSPLLPAALDAYASRSMPFRRVLPDPNLYFQRAPMFGALRERLNPQERVYIAHRHPDFTLMAKSGSLFRVPAVQDYEPQPSLRSAAYTVMLRSGLPMKSLNQYYFPMVANFRPQFRKRLLDLAAARYLVVDAAIDNSDIVSPPLYPLPDSGDAHTRLYENREALARARFVPRLEVVPDADQLLHRLAFGDDDLRQVAFVEVPPESGFLGAPGAAAAAGAVEITVDEPEHLMVRVAAPERGFLILADQFFSGWQATVNGAAAPILRANYLFRAVEVPAGDSTLEFRYRPTSLRLGAAISAATLGALVVAVVVRRRRRRAARAINAGAPEPRGGSA